MVPVEEARRVTAVIPNWNGRQRTERLLEKLRAQTHPLSEVIVVDNGSEDGSVEMARRRGARVIELGRNAGFSGAVNRGLAEARTEWVAILNNDVEPAPDWLERLREAARQAGAWFATGKLLSGHDRSRIDGAFDALCRGGCAWRAGHGLPDGPEWSRPRRIRLAPLTAALVRAEVFQKVGALDERFESYLEDVEFGLRCALAGGWGVYVPGAVAYHTGSATLGVWHRDTVRMISRNQLLLVAKHYSPRELGRWGWPILAAQLLWGLVALRRGRPGAWLRGKWEALRMWGGLRREAAWRGARPRRLSRILRVSEGEIFRLQRQAGFEAFWRLYFALTGLR
jgi:GT2 family glycosyltransferase